MIITLPWPPKELSPNARIHWAKVDRPQPATKPDAAEALGEFNKHVHSNPEYGFGRMRQLDRHNPSSF